MEYIQSGNISKIVYFSLFKTKRTLCRGQSLLICYIVVWNLDFIFWRSWLSISIKVFWFYISNASSFWFVIAFKNGFVQNYGHGQKMRKQMRNVKYNCYHPKIINRIYKSSCTAIADQQLFTYNLNLWILENREIETKIKQGLIKKP